jgi:hypothetical protein
LSKQDGPAGGDTPPSGDPTANVYCYIIALGAELRTLGAQLKTCRGG